MVSLRYVLQYTAVNSGILQYTPVYSSKFQYTLLPPSSCELSDEGRYLIIYISRGAEPRNKLLYSDLSLLEGGKMSGPLEVVKLVDNFEADWDVRKLIWGVEINWGGGWKLIGGGGGK